MHAYFRATLIADLPGLCNPYAANPFLRDVLGYKRPWVYYLAMVLDPILRFNWIFYAIFPRDFQHSALLSFLVSFSEVCRRGIWTLFRVENEHCTNVGRFRASRDVPLPYELPSSETASLEESHIHDSDSRPSPFTKPAPSTLEPDTAVSHTRRGSRLDASLGTPEPGSMHRRPTSQIASTPVQSGIARVGTIMTQAHAQDFERKRRPGLEQRTSRYEEQQTDSGESTDENDEDAEMDRSNKEDIIDAQGILQRQRSPAV